MRYLTAITPHTLALVVILMATAICIPCAGCAKAPNTEVPEQVIIIYTGDTLSKPTPTQHGEDLQGGVSALAMGIQSYMAQIVDHNRQRIINEGGDGSAVGVDMEKGLLGDHPYLLLDYGGWSRPNDPVGYPYVGLYFRLFRDFKYHAVGCKLYQKLGAERWDSYQGLDPFPELLVSSDVSPTASGRPQAVRVFTREMHGKLWGVVAVSLPVVNESLSYDEMVAAAVDDLRRGIDEAAGELEKADCDYGILMLSEGAREIYGELESDERFIAVIGAPNRQLPDGHGVMPEVGALLLPELDPGGKEVGVCHLIFSKGKSRPDNYFFTRWQCLDEPDMPLPYRKQVAEAVDEHSRLADEYKAEADKIAGQ